MAKKKNKNGDDNTVLIVLGTAVATAGVMYLVNRGLNERDELRSLRASRELKRLESYED